MGHASGEGISKGTNDVTWELHKNAGSGRPQACGSRIYILTGFPGDLKFEKCNF